MKNLLILIGFCLGLLSFTSKTTCLIGKIVDKDTDEGIPFCQIKILKGNKGIAAIQSDLDGNFKICKLKAGEYEITAFYEGYKDIKEKFIVTKNKITKLDLEFESKTFLDGFILSGNEKDGLN